MVNILIIDADPGVFPQIQNALGREAYHLTNARSPNLALQAMQRTPPDLIIMDTSLPQTDGVTLCRQLRSAPATHRLPILFLTSSDSAQEVASALDAGGDDFLRKPFSTRVLAARVRALLRRAASKHERVFLALEPDGQTINIAGRRVILTPTEYDLLEALSQHCGEHISAQRLLQVVWDYPPGAGDTALVRNHVRNLRVKLEEDPDRPRLVVSHHGRGYALTVDAVWHTGDSRASA